MTKRRLLISLLVAAVAAGSAEVGAVAVPLGSYNVDLHETSVSGISSGGYMAQQFHIAYSSLLRGVGIIAGGPYYCAQGNVALALTTCTTPTALNPPDATQSVQATHNAAAAQQIDPVSYLSTSKVWLFSGTKDETVFPVVVDRLAEYYVNFVPAANIFYERTIPAAHAMVTENYGHPCDYKGNGDNASDIFINDCDYDAAGKILAHIYGPLNPKAATLSGVFIEFRQDEFIADPVSHSMNAAGYAYVPGSCEDGAPCRVHVAFHGCRQQPARIGDKFYRNVGYNEWADTNRIIVLYPQTINSDLPPVYNPRGCWDWWGYDDPGYHTKGGRQMLAVRGMLGRLASGIHPTPPTTPTQVTVTGVTDRSVSLRWDESSGTPRVTGYNIYRATQSGGPYLKVNATQVQSTAYTATDLSPATTYYFVVRAVNKIGTESGDSKQVTATTSLLPPPL